MKAYTAVIERCPDTGMYVGYVPGFPGAHSQAESFVWGGIVSRWRFVTALARVPKYCAG